MVCWKQQVAIRLINIASLYEWASGKNKTPVCGGEKFPIQPSLQRQEKLLNKTHCRKTESMIKTIFCNWYMNRIERKSAFEHAQNGRFRSSCACAKYHLGLCSPFIISLVSSDYVSGQRRPWSDCASAQSDLGLRCPHMPEDTFLPGEARINNHIPLIPAVLWSIIQCLFETYYKPFANWTYALRLVWVGSAKFKFNQMNQVSVN